MTARPGVPRILLDCRWSYGGARRVTELLLRGLREVPTQADWTLWGPPEFESFLWPNATLAINSKSPLLLRGQRSWFEIPPSDLAVFMHQQRPLRKIPSLTFMYDTIPLRFAKNSLDRRARLIFLKRVASVSREIVTVSQYSRRRIVRDVGLPTDRVAVARLPFDDTFANRVLQLRYKMPRADVALFIGRFLPHKNLPRLIAAFGRTDFQARGGKLMLVGGFPEELKVLQSGLTPREREFVVLRGECSEGELDRLFATSLFLIQPSLEEGFGLPVWEAMCCGLPLAASDGGSLTEVTAGMVQHFPASSTKAMAEAIDECASKARSHGPEDCELISKQIQETSPTIQQFAKQFLTIIRRNLEPRGG